MLWNGLISCWTSIYTVFLNRIIVDQGSNFGPSFIRVVAIDGFLFNPLASKLTPESPTAKNTTRPHRKVVRKIMMEHPTSDFELLLFLSVQAMNDTIGPNGLLSSALLFGELPRLDITDDYEKRRKIYDEARLHKK